VKFKSSVFLDWSASHNKAKGKLARIKVGCNVVNAKSSVV